ncbi:MAG: hypothetical protein CR972_02235 [Candidatus Moraniibacteriota bacterium]|nr:MAG: hypothetical protein CR972_02235 [Candidatus Moranbacteria bacterium]
MRENTEKMPVADFVLSAIHELSFGRNPINGIHVVDSGLNAALHLYYGANEHPINLINSLIKQKVILAHLVKGGVQVYDPMHIAISNKNRCFREVSVRFKSLEKPAMEKDIRDFFLEVFNFTEVSRLTEGEIILTQGKKVKGSAAKKGITCKGIHNGSFKFVMQHAGNETCYEYFFTPTDAKKSQYLLNAIERALENAKKEHLQYNISDERVKSIAEAVINLIVPVSQETGDAESNQEDSATLKEGSSQDVNHLLPSDVEETGRDLILLAIKEKFGVNQSFHKSEFTRIVTQELGLTNPHRWFFSGMARMWAGNLGLIKYLRGSGCETHQYYALTERARRIIDKLENEGSDTYNEMLFSEENDVVAELRSLADFVEKKQEQDSNLQEIKNALLLEKDALEARLKDICKELQEIDEKIATSNVDLDDLIAKLHSIKENL